MDKLYRQLGFDPLQQSLFPPLPGELERLKCPPFPPTPKGEPEDAIAPVFLKYLTELKQTLVGYLSTVGQK
jgi:hypothetical protein